MEISFTRLRVYLECPWEYKLRFVDNRRIPLNPQSALGLTLHRALERYHRSGADTWEELLGCYEAEWLGSGYPDRDTAKDWRRRGERILRKWLDAERERRTELVGVEREFIYPLGRHTVRGMIDRIDRLQDGGVEVIDYKTQFDLGPADAAPSPAENAQLRFYALGARESLALPVRSVAVHYLAAGRRESAAYDPSGEEDLKALIVRVADAIERGVYSPDTSFCPRCPFQKSCAYSVVK